MSDQIRKNCWQPTKASSVHETRQSWEVIVQLNERELCAANCQIVARSLKGENCKIQTPSQGFYATEGDSKGRDKDQTKHNYGFQMNHNLPNLHAPCFLSQ